MIKIKVKLSETEEIELTVKQAKKLHEDLCKMFDNEKNLLQFFHTPIYEDYPEPRPYYVDPTWTKYPVITCINC